MMCLFMPVILILQVSTIEELCLSYVESLKEKELFNKSGTYWEKHESTTSFKHFFYLCHHYCKQIRTQRMVEKGSTFSVFNS